MLLIDTSASSADRLADGHTVLDLSRDAAALCSRALADAGHRCAIQGFSSAGRADVRVQRVQDFGEPPDATARRLGALRSAASTRLGAAIRHGTRRLLQQPPTRARHLVLLTDGEPHDIDVHEPHYLSEDARHAVREAARRGVSVFCFSVQPDGDPVLGRIFGPGRHHAVRTPGDLPAALARLWR